MYKPTSFPPVVLPICNQWCVTMTVSTYFCLLHYDPYSHTELCQHPVQSTNALQLVLLYVRVLRVMCYYDNDLCLEF